MEEQYQSRGPCACMGPQGDDPVCPCAMMQLGLEPTDNWTPEEVEKLKKVMEKWFVRISE